MSAPIRISGIEKLTALHEVQGFKCGENSLDHFLRRHALKNQLADISQTYVVHRDHAVLGFYTLVYGTISMDDAAPQICRWNNEFVPCTGDVAGAMGGG